MALSAAQLINRAAAQFHTFIRRQKGAFCLTFTDGKTLYAARDPHGVRPLVIGRLAQGWVVASETCALDIVGAQFIREVEPGELISVNEAGIHSEKFAEPKRQGCVSQRSL